MIRKLPRYMLLSLSVFYLLAIAVLCKALLAPNAKYTRDCHYESISIAGEYSINDDPEYHPLANNAALDTSALTTLHVRGHFTMPLEKRQEVLMRIDGLRVRIDINGKNVFTFGEEGTYPSFMHTGGSVCADFVSDGIAQDDMVEITLSNSANSPPTAFSNFFRYMMAGCEFALYTDLINLNILDLIISILSYAIGLFMLVITLYTIRFNHGTSSHYVFLAGFIMASGCWFFSGSPIISLLIPYPAFIEILYTLSIYSMAVFFLIFMIAYVNGKLRKMLLSLSGVLLLSVIFSIILQYLGIVDLYATLTYHLILILAISVVFMACLIYEQIRLKSKAAIKFMASLIILFASALIDAIYYFSRINPLNKWYKIGFLIFAVLQFVEFFEIHRDNMMKIKEYSKMEKELLQSRISVMLSQIKPHFLYNTLNAISSLCMTDPQKADEAVYTLSSYLRGNIQALELSGPIPFTHELSHIKNYVDIEKMRFGSKLNFICDIGYSNFSVPALSLQALVENAIRHGISMRPDGGTVLLKTEVSKQDIIIQICDDGVGFELNKQDDKHKGIGLENAKMRLKYMMNAEMTIKTAPSRGTAITIRIPVHQEENK